MPKSPRMVPLLGGGGVRRADDLADVGDERVAFALDDHRHDPAVCKIIDALALKIRAKARDDLRVMLGQQLRADLAAVGHFDLDAGRLEAFQDLDT